MAKKTKFYVVWKGRKTGVFTSWDDCKEQTNGFDGAVFKSFETKELAEKAFHSSSYDYIGKDKKVVSQLSEEELLLIGSPIEESIAVDGAWDNNTGLVEYQGVNYKTKEVLFHVGPLEDGTINMVEFLAIVHALALSKQEEWTLPIYSDSKIAIGWVSDKQVRTNHEPSEKNKKLFEMLDRAEKWLANNTYENNILKWETKAWGENPADFGRK
ncbi:viroplasmin family protein [Flavobacterium enshiense]|uniref:ribonuclease H1 domain-containing protein n=1 Tax=Flavobacterium enshiense TaxID=1341165 RepID=UPI001FCBA741|nr:ribonuclease H family protein [Flavobacterium enshiense]UOK41495.1 ribonuclease H family protein [Flavobacterium enshiense]